MTNTSGGIVNVQHLIHSMLYICGRVLCPGVVKWLNGTANASFHFVILSLVCPICFDFHCFANFLQNLYILIKSYFRVACYFLILAILVAQTFCIIILCIVVVFCMPCSFDVHQNSTILKNSVAVVCFRNGDLYFTCSFIIGNTICPLASLHCC